MEYKDYVQMLKELSDYDGNNMNQWAIDFVEGVHFKVFHASYTLTTNQKAKIAEIWDEVLG